MINQLQYNNYLYIQMEVRPRKRQIQKSYKLLVIKKTMSLAKKRQGTNLLQRQRHNSVELEPQKKLNGFQVIDPDLYKPSQLIDQKVIQIEKFDEIKGFGKKRQQLFYDEKFPPNNESLCGQWKHIRKWNSIKWQRISDKIPNSQIFVDKPTPTDIKQGKLGNCYFLAGLAALAQRPDRIYSLFLNEKNEFSIYSLRILYKGKWIKIDLDDYIPYQGNQPAFSQSIDKQLWVILLEKAWSKLYTSYKRTQAGYLEQALHDLTGAPIKLIYPKNGSHNKDYQWKYLLKASQLEYSMVCSSKPGSDTNKSQSGIVEGHAYTLLNALQLNFEGKKVRLLQLRNPWGQVDFTGAWSDNDPIWNKVDKNQKKRIGFKQGNDGIFFISFDDFWKEFTFIAVAEINDKASYLYCSCKDKQKKGSYFAISINKEGIYSLQVDKTPERSFQFQKQSSYYYPSAFVDLIFIDNDKCTNIQGFHSKNRLTQQKYKMKPGTYIAKVIIDFDQKWQQDYDVNLAIYAQYPCSISLASKQQTAIFEKQQKQTNKIIFENAEKLIQVTQIEELLPIQKLNELRREEKSFIDNQFPPNNNSLCGQWSWENSQKNEQDKAWQKTRKKIKWFKISDKIANSKLYVDKPNPNDIIQGSIGDCYFLAGLAALAQKPSRIYRLFLQQEKNESNYYSVRILYKGKWVKIDMDEYIPFEDNQPAFSQSVDKQLWVILLQKAWAKLYGSYKRIEGGFSEQPLHDLTGAPIVMLLAPKNNLQKQSQWQYLLKASKLQYSMVCSSNPGSDTNTSKTGIVLGHAYTLLNATHLTYKGKKIQLLQIRNPWGKGEFKRDWSDKDKKWKEISQVEKDRIGFREVREDGIFFISFDDFWKDFQEITIAEINDNASYIFKSSKDSKSQGCYFKIEIYKTGNYSLQVDKTPQRCYQYRYWENFEYANASIGLVQLTKGKVRKIQQFESSERTTIINRKLNAGTYIAKVKIDFIPQWQKDYEVNLAIYAQYPCAINLASKQEAASYEGKNVSWTGNQQENKKNVSFIGPKGSTSRDMITWKLPTIS